MNVLIASDKFKGTLTAFEVSEILARSFEGSGVNATNCPLADGGDGTAEILTRANQGKILEVTVADPLFRKTGARYGWSQKQRTAYMEMAEASGIALLDPTELNPASTTTYGTGELILEATRKGAKRIIMGVGGSATNDGGIGMASALGYRFLDQEGKPVQGCGGNLEQLRQIEAPKRLELPAIEVAVDVTAPLYGERGAAYTYAAQKGADPQMIRELDRGLRNLAALIKKDLGLDIAEETGSGAAGGLAAGLIAFAGARLRSGIKMVMDETGFDRALSHCDLVITGEGKFDEQSLQGKVVGEVIRRAEKTGKRTMVVCGVSEIHDSDVEIYSLSEIAGSVAEAMAEPARYLHIAGKMMIRQLRSG